MRVLNTNASNIPMTEKEQIKTRSNQFDCR